MVVIKPFSRTFGTCNLQKIHGPSVLYRRDQLMFSPTPHGPLRLDWTGLDRTGPDRTVPDWTGLDWDTDTQVSMKVVCFYSSLLRFLSKVNRFVLVDLTQVKYWFYES